MVEFPDNVVELINEKMGGYDRAMGLVVVSLTPDALTTELEVGDQHLQPYGLVHGGVYAGMIEASCSIGAALNVMPEGKNAVGLENSTSFLRAVRSGKLSCTARPLNRSKRSHVWEAEVRDDSDRLVASGRVRMLILEPGAKAGGSKVGLD
jgi:uncharacterized protein (TIGR00369 family)